MRFLKSAFCALLVCLLPAAISADENYRRLTSVLSSAACVEFEFLSILESDIFDTVDSASGSAYLARDGRYLIHLQSDLFLHDNEILYSYSSENNQVTLEKTDSTYVQSARVSFITRLDELYDYDIITAGKKYRLMRRNEVSQEGTPDSLILIIDSARTAVEQIIYFDLNDDRQRIVVLDQKLYEQCNDERFAPAWPDSVEMIRLY